MYSIMVFVFRDFVLTVLALEERVPLKCSVETHKMVK